MGKQKQTLEAVLKKIASLDRQLKSATGKKKKSLYYAKHGLLYRSRKAGMRIPKNISRKIEQSQLTNFSKIDPNPQMMDLMVEKIMKQVTEQIVTELTDELKSKFKKQA